MVICNRKQIADKEFNIAFKKIMSSHSGLVRHKEKLNKLYSEKFDPEDESHRNMLFELWEILKQNRDIKLQDRKWRKHKI